MLFRSPTVRARAMPEVKVFGGCFSPCSVSQKPLKPESTICTRGVALTNLKQRRRGLIRPEKENYRPVGRRAQIRPKICFFRSYKAPPVLL